MKKLIFILAYIIGGTVNFSLATETQGALSLLETASARSSALGEAFSAISDDVSGLHYNPSSLASLESSQVSFSFQRGFSEDSFGQFMAGTRTKKGGLGFSVGYYNGGTIQLADRVVTAQKDLTVNLAFGRRWGKVSAGAAGKYLSSELGETYSASAFAGDLGMQYNIHPRLNLGGALQNYGSKLKFQDQGDELPRIARLGLSYLLIPNQSQTLLLVDAPYYINRSQVVPSIGVETSAGPLRFRAGYKADSGTDEFSVGTGFLLGDTTMDYAFGLINSKESLHRASLSIRFEGIQNETTPEFVSPLKEQPKREVVELVPEFEPKVSILASVEESKALVSRKEAKIIIERWMRKRLRLGDTYNSAADWEEIYENQYELFQEIMSENLIESEE